jgi:hypothetical protein
MQTAEIDRVVRGRPRLQLATQGRWELALHAPLPLSLRALETLLERLAETEVAAEVLSPRPPTVFVGARFRRTERSHLRVIAARANCAPSYALKAVGSR